jgi:hypothetical protein
MPDDKINKLQQALGQSADLNLKPSINSPIELGKDKGISSIGLGQKFGSQNLGHDPKALKDPKGKNKQVLKGNAKSMRH